MNTFLGSINVFRKVLACCPLLSDSDGWRLDWKAIAAAGPAEETSGMRLFTALLYWRCVWKPWGTENRNHSVTPRRGCREVQACLHRSRDSGPPTARQHMPPRGYWMKSECWRIHTKLPSIGNEYRSLWTRMTILFLAAPFTVLLGRLFLEAYTPPTESNTAPDQCTGHISLVCIRLWLASCFMVKHYSFWPYRCRCTLGQAIHDVMEDKGGGGGLEVL